MDPLNRLIRSLDPGRTGQLNRIQLVELCSKFSLSNEETNRVVRALLPDPLGSVSELQVRVEFPKVIREQVAPPVVSSENESEGSLAEPKYVRNDGRAFGRRTRPRHRNLGGEDKEKVEAPTSGNPPASQTTSTAAAAPEPAQSGATASAAAVALAAATAPAAVAGGATSEASPPGATQEPAASSSLVDQNSQPVPSQQQPSEAPATIASRSRSPGPLVAPQPIKPSVTVEEPTPMTSTAYRNLQQEQQQRAKSASPSRRQPIQPQPPQVLPVGAVGAGGGGGGVGGLSGPPRRAPPAGAVPVLPVLPSSGREVTYRGEGAFNKVPDYLSQLAAAGAQSGRSEEEYLRSIWQELGVGRSGYLTLPELARVCEYIGMDDLTDSHLYQLFENLDEDGDGHVSFNEFVRGLFRHTPNPSVSGPAGGIGPGGSPRPPSRGGGGGGGGPSSGPMRRSRSSGTPGNTVTLFSSIDKDGTGYARGTDICRFLSAHGLLNGEEILKFLQFDANTRVNLAELTYALDTELAGVTDGVTQAGILAYQAELRHSRASLESAVAERNKLRMDLAEEKQRVANIIREGDEAQRETERHQAKQMANVEKRYQEQIRSLQAQMDYERDRFQTEFLKQRKSMEHVILSLKDEETRLKDRIASLQREMGRCESEQMDLVERLAESEKLNVRQQRELDAVAELHRKLNSMADQLKDSVPSKEHAELQAEADELRLEVKRLRDWVDELTGRLRPRKRLRRSGRGDKLDDSSACEPPEEARPDDKDVSELASRKSATMLEEHCDVTVATRRSRTVRKLTAETETEEEAEWLVGNKVQASAYNDVIEALKHNFEEKMIRLEKKHNNDLVLRLQAVKLLYDKKAEELRLNNLALQEASERKDATIGILRLDVECLKQARDELEEKLRLLNDQLDQIDTAMLDNLPETIRNRVGNLVRARLAQLHALDRARLMREFSQHKERLLLLAAQNENRFSTADVETQTGDDMIRNTEILQQATEALSRTDQLHWLSELPSGESQLLVESVCDRLQQLKGRQQGEETHSVGNPDRVHILEATELLARLPELQWLQQIPEAQRVNLTANVCNSLQQLKNSGGLALPGFDKEDSEEVNNEQSALHEVTQLLSKVPDLYWIQELPLEQKAALAVGACKGLRNFTFSGNDDVHLNEAARILSSVSELQWLKSLPESQQRDLIGALTSQLAQLRQSNLRAKYSGSITKRKQKDSALLHQAIDVLSNLPQLPWLKEMSPVDKELLGEAISDSMQKLRDSQKIEMKHPDLVLEAIQLLSKIPELQWIQDVPQTEQARLGAAVLESWRSFRNDRLLEVAEKKEPSEALILLSKVSELRWLSNLSKPEQLTIAAELDDKIQQLKDPKLRSKFAVSTQKRPNVESELLQRAVEIISESPNLEWIKELPPAEKELLAEAVCDNLKQIRLSQPSSESNSGIVFEATQLLSKVPELQWIQDVPQTEQETLVAVVCDRLQNFKTSLKSSSPHDEKMLQKVAKVIVDIPELRWLKNLSQSEQVQLAAGLMDRVQELKDPKLSAKFSASAALRTPTDSALLKRAVDVLSDSAQFQWLKELPQSDKELLGEAVWHHLQQMKVSHQIATEHPDLVFEATQVLSKVPELRWIQDVPHEQRGRLATAVCDSLRMFNDIRADDKQKFKEAALILSGLPELQWLNSQPESKQLQMVGELSNKLQQGINDSELRAKYSKLAMKRSTAESAMMQQALHVLSESPQFQWIKELPQSDKELLAEAVCDSLQQLKVSQQKVARRPEVIFEATQLLSKIPELQWIQDVPQTERERLTAAVSDSLKKLGPSAFSASTEDRGKLLRAVKVLSEVPELQWLQKANQSEIINLADTLSIKLHQFKNPGSREKYLKLSSVKGRSTAESSLLQRAVTILGESPQHQWLKDLPQVDKQLLAEAVCDSLQQLKVSQQMRACHPQLIFEATQLLSNAPELRWIQDVPQTERERLATAVCDSLQSFETARHVLAGNQEAFKLAATILSEFPELQWLKSLPQSDQIEMTATLSGKLQELIKDLGFRAKYSKPKTEKPIADQALLQQAVKILSESPELHWLKELPQADKELLAEAICDTMQQIGVGKKIAAKHPELIFEATQLLSKVPELRWIQDVPQTEQEKLAAAVLDTLQNFNSTDSAVLAEDQEKFQDAVKILSEVPQLHWLKSLSHSEQLQMSASLSNKLRELINDPEQKAKFLESALARKATDADVMQRAVEALSESPQLQWLNQLPQADKELLAEAVCHSLQQLRASQKVVASRAEVVLEATQLLSKIPQLRWIQDVPQAERERLAAVLCDGLMNQKAGFSYTLAEDQLKLQEAATILSELPELQWLKSLSHSEQLEMAATLGKTLQNMIKDPELRAKYLKSMKERSVQDQALLQQAVKVLSESPQFQWLNELPQADKELLAEAVCDSFQQLRLSKMSASHPESIFEATQLLSKAPELRWIQDVPERDRDRLASAVCDSLRNFKDSSSVVLAEDRENFQEAVTILKDLPELMWLKSLSQSEQLELVASMSTKLQELLKDPELRAKYSKSALSRPPNDAALLQRAVDVLSESSQLHWLKELPQSDKELLAEAVCDSLQKLKASREMVSSHPEIVCEVTQLLSKAPQLQWIQDVPQAERDRLTAAVCDGLEKFRSGHRLSTESVLPSKDTTPVFEATELLTKTPELRWIQEVPSSEKRSAFTAANENNIETSKSKPGSQLSKNDQQIVFEATEILSTVPELRWIQDLPQAERTDAVCDSLQQLRSRTNKYELNASDKRSTPDSSTILEALEVLSKMPELNWIQEVPQSDRNILATAFCDSLQRHLTSGQANPETNLQSKSELAAPSSSRPRVAVDAKSFYIDPCWKYRLVRPQIGMSFSTRGASASAATAADVASSELSDSSAEEDHVDEAVNIKLFSPDSQSLQRKSLRDQTQTDPPKDERVEMQNLKIQLEKEIDDLRRSKTLDENYRSKVDELNATNERLQLQNQQAEEAMEQMAQNEAAVSAAEKAANERFAKENKKLEEELEETRKRLNEAEAELEFKTNELNGLKENHDKLTEAVSKGQQNLEKEMVYCDIKQKEIDDLKKNVDKLTAERDKNKELLERVRTDLEDKNNELEETQKKLEQLKTDKDQLEKGHKDLELKLEAEQNEKASLNEANNTMSAALDQSNKSLEDKDAEIERKEEQLNEAKEEATKYRQENEELERKVITAEKEVEKKDDELKSLQTTVGDMEREKEDLTKQVQDLEETVRNKEQEINTFKSNNEKLSASVEQQSKSLEKKSADLEVKQREIESLKAEKNKLNQDRREEEARLQEKVKEQYKETLDAKRERDDLNRTKASLEKQIEKLKQKIESQQKDIAQMKENIENLTSSLDTSEKTLEDTNKHCKELEEELNKLKDEKNRLENEREDLTRKLTDTEADKDRLQRETEDLKKATETAEKEKEAIQREMDDYRREAEAAADELKKSNESVTKSLDKAMKNLETRNQEFQAKAREAQSNREAKDALAMEKDRLEHALRKANTELEKRTQDLARAKSDKERVEAAHYESERRAKDAEHRLAERTRDLADQRSKYEQLQAEKAELEAGAREQRARTQELQNEVSGLKRERDRLQRELEDLRRSADTMETKKMDVEKELDTEKKNSGKLRRDAESLQDRIRELEARLDGKDREIADAKAAQEEAQRERKKLQRDLDDQRKTAESLKSTNERLEEELQEVGGKLDREIGKTDGSGGDLTDQLKFENSRLTKQKLELSREVAELKDKLKAAEIKVEREKDENDDLLKETRNLNAKIKEIQNMLYAQERENKELKRFNDNLEGAIRSSEAEERNKAERLERDCEQRVKSAKAQLAQKEAELAQLKEDAEGQYAARKAAEEFANRLDRNFRKKELEAEKLLEEKRSLEAQVEELNNQLRTDRTDRNRYNELLQKLNEAQKKADTLEKALNMKNSETSKMLLNTQEGFQRQVQTERREREEMQQKMERQQQLLAEQTDKMKKQLERTAKTDKLLKELYAENAQLMKALQVTEQRQKMAEQRCQQLDDKCRNLQKVLGRVSQSAAH